MSLWNWWKREPPPDEADEADDEQETIGPIPLPTEPFVYECRACGKVFESRRRHPVCPECDSDDTEAVS